MKAILMGLTLGAMTFAALNAGGLSATEDGARQIETVLYEPVPSTGTGGFSELASISVLAPQRIAWDEAGERLYIQGLDHIALFDPAQASTSRLIDIPSNEMVLDISPKGEVAVMRDFEAVILRNAHDGSEVTLAQDVNISSASFAPDGETLALILDDGSVLQMWDVESMQLTGQYTSPSVAERAYSVTFAPSGERLTWYSVMGGQALDLASGELGPFVAFNAAIYDVQMCTDDALVVANDGSTVTFWDTTTGEMVHSSDNLQVYSSSCSLDGELLAVTTESNVGLLEVPTLSPAAWLPLEAVDAELTQSGDRLAIVGVDGQISIWQGN